MDRMLYIAMSGAKQTMLAQGANSNNMANANTAGFRADLASFRSMPVYGPGAPTRVYAMAERAGIDSSSGTVIPTGRALDVAIKDSGWIAIQSPDGSEAYTRAGNFKLGAGGILSTRSGYPVLGNGGPIALPPAEKIEIGTDGTISIRGIGQSASTLTVIDRIKLVNIKGDDLVKGADGLIRTMDGQDAVADASVNLIAGALESSNVSAVESMVSMITLARHYEAQVKMMKAAEDMDSASSELLSISG
ncbi:MAG: flagellar basal-body rod protein FlgF [Ectothiorhodospiraceae bacterium]|nr:flagellar basal-body rod protein FlgF [Ectothiorhodospiraceae bacterium]